MNEGPAPARPSDLLEVSMFVPERCVCSLSCLIVTRFGSLLVVSSHVSVMVLPCKASACSLQNWCVDDTRAGSLLCL